MTHSVPTRRSTELNVSIPRSAAGRTAANWAHPTSSTSALVRVNAPRTNDAAAKVITAWSPRATSAEVPNQSTTRSAEHTSELQSLMRISSAVFCLNTKKTHRDQQNTDTSHT